MGYLVFWIALFKEYSVIRRSLVGCWVREVMSRSKLIGRHLSLLTVIYSGLCMWHVSLCTQPSFSVLVAHQETLLFGSIDEILQHSHFKTTCSNNLWLSVYALSLPKGNHLPSAMIYFYLLTVEFANWLNKSDSNVIKLWRVTAEQQLGCSNGNNWVLVPYERQFLANWIKYGETWMCSKLKARFTLTSDVSVPSVQFAGYACRTPHGRHWHVTDNFSDKCESTVIIIVSLG
jgi:hypothetical protein